MAGLFSRLLGDANAREINRLRNKAEAVNALEAMYKSLSDDALRAKTAEFKERLARGATEDELLPETFAVVREAARRFTGMRPFDVQVIGGIVLHQGRTAEMKTGEGKTLVATMPAYLNALSGKGVHVVTVNDYLARRDSEWMGKIYRNLGLSVGLIVHGLNSQQRRAAYAADITYGTNNEFGFDYLRDNMVLYKEQLVQRGLHFAIVDEVDSILIDEARTPLIISSPVSSSESEHYQRWNRHVQQLVKKQNALIRELLQEAQQCLESDRERAGELLLLVRRGAPKNKQLLKLAKEPGVEKLIVQARHRLTTEKRLAQLDEQLYFTIDEATGVVAIHEKGNRELARQDPEVWKLLSFDRADEAEGFTDEQWQEESVKYDRQTQQVHYFNQLVKVYTLYENEVNYVVQDGKVIIVDEFTGRLMWGRRYSDGLHQAIEAKEGVKVQESSRTVASITFQNYFRMYEKLSGMTGTAATEEDELRNIYGMDVVVIPTNKPMIRRDLPDRVYRTERAKFKAVVQEIAMRHSTGQPVLVGTISVEKSEMVSRMLKRQGLPHSVLNAVNHQKEAQIIAQAGRKGVITISTNMAGRGTDIILGGNAEYLARDALVRELQQQGRGPELQNGADPVELAPDRFQELLEEQTRQTAREREEVLAAGGLHVLGTERHESRRIDNQLRGRAGRQGDPGTSRFYISLEDDLMRLFKSDNIAPLLDRLGMDEEQVIDHPLIGKAIENAQKRVEGRNFEIRKHVLEYDDILNQQREVIYAQRRRVLEGEELRRQILEMIEEVITAALDRYLPQQVFEEEWDYRELLAYADRTFLPGHGLQPPDLDGLTREEIRSRLLAAANELYDRREAELGAEIMRELERVILLRTVDARWMDHIDAMHDLRQGIGLRAFGQKDPLVEYRYELYEMFEGMIAAIHEDVARLVFRVQVKAPPQRTSPASVQDTSPVRSRPGAFGRPGGAAATGTPPPKTAKPKIGRNAPCPCGSGKKYKKCCGAGDSA